MLHLALWLGLGLLFSTVTKKRSTSILMSVATRLFYSIIISVIAMLANLYNEAGSSILDITGGGFVGPGAGTPFRHLELAQGLMASWPQITAIAGWH